MSDTAEHRIRPTVAEVAAWGVLVFCLPGVFVAAAFGYVPVAAVIGGVAAAALFVVLLLVSLRQIASQMNSK